jgi:mRNA-degrading endonuclease toxin of MazEF toxin-antitoxin module
VAQGASAPNPGASASATVGPGDIYTVDPSKVNLPSTQAQLPPREKRWLLVVSCKDDCRQAYFHTVLVVLLTAKLDTYWAPHDVTIEKGNGGTELKCLAQADMIFPMLKSDLLAGTRKGGLLKDTLRQVRAHIGNAIGLDASSAVRGA